MSRLFVAALERLEDAHDLAAAGQAPDQDAAELAALATDLTELAQEVAVLADAARVAVQTASDGEEGQAP